MIELSPGARKIFDQARRDVEPNEARLQAVRAAIEARIAPTLQPGSADGAALKSAAASKGVMASTLTPWLGIGIAVAIASAGAAIYSVSRIDAPSSSATPPAPAAVSASSAPSNRSIDPPAKSIEALPGVASAPPDRAESRATAQQESRRAARTREAIEAHRTARDDSHPSAKHLQAPPPSPVQTTSDSSGDGLAEELALLRSARRALDRGNAQEALALCKQHAMRFPRGILAEERQATRVSAFCALGERSAARGAAMELARVVPRSPHLVRIWASCAGPEPAELNE